MNKRIAVTLALLGLTGALTGAQQQTVTLRVVGFETAAAERGTPIDAARKKFLADAQAAIPGLRITSEEAPPDEAQRIVDLAAGTAPDVWYQDASSLARVAATGNLLDMRRCLDLAPRLKLNRFFPSVLAIHQQRADAPIYGLPDGFTPMVIYYNPEVFAKTNVALPKANWTWTDFLRTAQLLTVDNRGRNATNANFDENNVVQWGYRVRKFPFEWVYRLWQNGGDVLSPDGRTASGYLDSAASLEALQFHVDLVRKYKVAPSPSALDRLNQQLGFLDRFLRGEFAMFDRGHWELVGLYTNAQYRPSRVAVIEQPRKKNGATVIYESSWVINKALERDPRKLEAACKLVERATDLGYQATKVTTGLEISANQFAAASAIQRSRLPEVEKAFFDAVKDGRAPYGSKYAFYPAVETILDSMMDRLLNGAALEPTVRQAVAEINREASRR